MIDQPHDPPMMPWKKTRTGPKMSKRLEDVGEDLGQAVGAIAFGVNSRCSSRDRTRHGSTGYGGAAASRGAALLG
jgi:hypothetical protein